MKAEIFRAYDIRGIYPDDIDESGVFCVAQNFVKILQQEKPDKTLKIAVGRDMRVSSPKLHASAVKGVVSMGAEVVDIGLASTPTFYFAVAQNGYDGGLEISASHNPKEYNGIKIVREEAQSIGLANGLDKIRDACVVNGEHKPQGEGKIEKKEDVLAERVKYALSFYDFSKIKPLKVVADPANAMGAPDLEALFAKLPCELVKMNFKLDGTFPVHEADPFKMENVADLRQKVVAEKADLGIATDGDADRIFFIDNRGEFVEPAIIRGLMAQEALKHTPGAKVGYDIRPGMITREMIEGAGGKPFVTKVGHSLIKQHSRQEKAVFSGESSGHFFFQTKFGFFETPLIVALVILKEISESGKSLVELTKPYQKYFHSGEINSEVEDKEAKMKELEKKFGQGAKNVSWLDGITVEHKDWWFNVRPSNTEPKLRLNLEARDAKLMEKWRDKVLEVIRR